MRFATPEVLVPPGYSPGTFSGWSMIPSAGTVQNGYVTGPEEEEFFVLGREGRVWMSTSRMERESHAVHLKHARGTVVVCGLGMGMFAYNLARRRDVDRVAVFEIDDSIISFVGETARRQGWPGWDKVRVVSADALSLGLPDLVRAGMADREPDYLYVDIWPTMAPERAVNDVRLVQDKVRARTVGWWTQELEFVLWCAERADNLRAVSLDHFDAWNLDLGFVTEERSRAYLSWCFAAARVASGG